MKRRIVILLVVSAILVSFGATKIASSPAPANTTELQATANPSLAPIGGIGSEDH